MVRDGNKSETDYSVSFGSFAKKDIRKLKCDKSAEV